jgi:hypothetical protein
MVHCLTASENVTTDDVTDLIWNSTDDDLWEDARDAILEDTTDANVAVEQLSLTWVRCYPGANPNLRFAGAYSPVENVTKEDLDPTAQRLYFAEVWTTDFRRLLAEYAASIAAGSDLSLDERGTIANALALENASGGSGCGLNGPAAAWFWFTGKCWKPCY